MHLRVLGLSLLFATASFARQPHDYWMVGRSGNDSILQFVDASSIKDSAKSARRAWTVSFRSDKASQFPGTHMVALQEFNCGTRQSRWLQLAYYDDHDRPIPDTSVDAPQSWRYPILGSVGDTELQFVCGGESKRRTLGNRISPNLDLDDFARAYFKQVEERSAAADPK